MFNPEINSKTQNNNKPTKNNRNVTELIICFRPRQKRKHNRTICTRAKHNNYMMQWHDKVTICFRASNVSLSNIVDFGQVKSRKKHNKVLTYTRVKNIDLSTIVDLGQVK